MRSRFPLWNYRRTLPILCSRYPWIHGTIRSPACGSDVTFVVVMSMAPISSFKIAAREIGAALPESTFGHLARSDHISRSVEPLSKAGGLMARQNCSSTVRRSNRVTSSIDGSTSRRLGRTV
jgi:hypothetical protein